MKSTRRCIRRQDRRPHEEQHAEIEGTWPPYFGAKEPAAYVITRERFCGASSLGIRTQQLDPYGRRLWDNPGGRHSNFDKEAVLRMQAKLEEWLHARKASEGRLPPCRADADSVRDFVLGLAHAEGVASSYDILKKRVARPVFRKLGRP